MKCLQVLLLIFIFVFSIFAYDSEYYCKRGGKCGRPISVFDYQYNYTMQEPKISDFCYYYKCRVAEWKVMNGFGTHEDFINTCKYIDPMIKRQIASRNVCNENFLYNDDHLILAICPPNEVEQCEKFLMDTKTYLEIHKQFDDDAHLMSVFYHERDYKECSYNNTPLAQLPQVQCETGGFCRSGKEFRLYEYATYAKFGVTKTCDACVMFICSLDGKQIIVGNGCYDEFVKACNKTNLNAVARFKENIKANFYHDSSMIVASCSDSDNCHKYAFDNYFNFEIFRNVSIDENAEKECSYEITLPTVTTGIAPHMLASTPDVSFLPTSTENVRVPEEPDHQKSSGITSIKLFVGIYFLLAVIY